MEVSSQIIRFCVGTVGLTVARYGSGDSEEREKFMFIHPFINGSTTFCWAMASSSVS
jgi:hypothetical protein